MTNYSDYVQCGEIFRSSTRSNEKPYLFKCIKCRDLFQLQAFLTHSEQNLCELREITIKEEILDDGCLSGCYKRDSLEGINSNSIDEIVVKQGSLVVKKDEDISNADEKEHVRYKIESSDAEVDAEQQEFETDVPLDGDFDLDDDKYDSEHPNVTDETEYLVKRKRGNEQNTYTDNKENENIVGTLPKVLNNQAIMLQKLSNIESELEKLKAVQVQTSAVIKQLVKRNVHVGNVPDFPIPNLEEMERINSLVCDDPDSYIAKIKTIVRPAGLEKNFDRIFASEVYVALNFDGVNGKRGFKEFKALHDAVFDAVKDDGYTVEKFKKELQLCFKTYKNRHFAKKCRDKKKT